MKYNAKIDELLEQLGDDDSGDHFSLLYNLLYDKFFRIAIYYLKNEEWTQEVVLDVFLVLWNKRADLIHIHNFENYYFTLLKNASLNYLEKQKHSFLPLDSEMDVKNPETPESHLLNDELVLMYVNALEELPPKCREIFILIREHGLSYSEVANQLNISVKTVDSQLQKATKVIKEKLNSYFS